MSGERRRWVTVAEITALAGVAIAGVGQWQSWSDRRASDAERTAATVGQERARARVDLGAVVEDGGRRLILKDRRHEIQDVRIAFPAALGVSEQRPVAEPAIERDWFDGPLLKLTDGGPDRREGRLPVMVTVRYLEDDATRSATGLYDVLWRTEGHALRGRSLELLGLRLRRRGGTRADLDRAWAQEAPNRQG